MNDHEPRYGGEPRDVRAVLGEMGAEGSIANLESRVESLEQELDRATAHAGDAERSYRGEMDLMRARIEAALELVQDTMEEQRSAWSQFEQRFEKLVAESEDNSRTFVNELRDELTPRVQRVAVQMDETRAQLKGEIAAIAADAEERSEAAARALNAARSGLQHASDGWRRDLESKVEEQSRTISSLEHRVLERVAWAEEAIGGQDDEARGRVDALRRELDETAGEIRAAVSSRAAELAGALGEVHKELAQALDEQGANVAGLEQRVLEQTRAATERIERAELDLRESIRIEREGREKAHEEFSGRIGDLVGTVDELKTKSGGPADARIAADVDQMRRDLDEFSGRLDALQGKVANAVGQVASSLSNRVASVAGDIEAVRDVAMRQEERLGAIEHLDRRITELASRQSEFVDTPPEGVDGERLELVEQALAGVRQQLSALSASVESSREQTREVSADVRQLSGRLGDQDGMRKELRELATRSSELSHRLDETERLARAAGQAIAAAVRKARGERARPAEAVSSASPVFQEAPSPARGPEDRHPASAEDTGSEDGQTEEA